MLRRLFDWFRGKQIEVAPTPPPSPMIAIHHEGKVVQALAIGVAGLGLLCQIQQRRGRTATRMVQLYECVDQAHFKALWHSYHVGHTPRWASDDKEATP